MAVLMLLAFMIAHCGAAATLHHFLGECDQLTQVVGPAPAPWPEVLNPAASNLEECIRWAGRCPMTVAKLAQGRELGGCAARGVPSFGLRAFNTTKPNKAYPQHTALGCFFVHRIPWRETNELD